MELNWKNEWTVPSIVGLVSFGIGVGVGYGIRSYREKKFVKDFHEMIDRNEQEIFNLENEVDGLNDKVRLLSYEPEEEEDIQDSRDAHPSTNLYASASGLTLEEMKPPIASIFDPEIHAEDLDWDMEAELASRTNLAMPYVIHRREFDEMQTDAEDRDFSQSTLTYYEGDDVLCDEHDIPVYDAKAVASPLTFGKGSGDPHIVYIRNERLEADYEVILDRGHYAVEILGAEMEHSFDKKEPLRKLRPE